MFASRWSRCQGLTLALRDEVDTDGRRLVVRNGFHEPREVMTVAGAVPVRQPRVNDKRIHEGTGERQRFSSAILPAWSRRSPRVAEVLPLLYLHGLSSSDFGPALEQFLGSDRGLSAATITRLTSQWQDEGPGVQRPVVGRLGLCVTAGSTASISRFGSRRTRRAFRNDYSSRETGPEINGGPRRTHANETRLELRLATGERCPPSSASEHEGSPSGTERRPTPPTLPCQGRPGRSVGLSQAGAESARIG